MHIFLKILVNVVFFTEYGLKDASTDLMFSSLSYLRTTS